MVRLILLVIIGVSVGCGEGSPGELITPGANTALERGTRPVEPTYTNSVPTVTVGDLSSGGLTAPGANTPMAQGTRPVEPTNTTVAATVTVGDVSSRELPTPGPSTVLEQATRPVEPTNTGGAATVTVGDVSFVVELAATPAQRAQGLSRHPPLAAGSGMLFVFEAERRHSFWMKEMLFPLDILWIDSQCVLADITENAPKPEPGQTLNDLPTFAPSTPVKYVLEVNGGTVQQTGFRRGDRVIFAGSLAGRFGC